MVVGVDLHSGLYQTRSFATIGFLFQSQRDLPEIQGRGAWTWQAPVPPSFFGNLDAKHRATSRVYGHPKVGWSALHVSDLSDSMVGRLLTEQWPTQRDATRGALFHVSPGEVICVSCQVYEVICKGTVFLFTVEPTFPYFAFSCVCLCLVLDSKDRLSNRCWEFFVETRGPWSGGGDRGGPLVMSSQKNRPDVLRGSLAWRRSTI